MADRLIDLARSKDGGHTFSDFVSRSAGDVGDFNHPIIWRRLGYARDHRARIRYSEPTRFDLLSVSIQADNE